MRTRLVTTALVAVLAVALMGATGCRRVPLEDVEGPSGISVERISIPLAGAQQLDARFEVPAGEFSLSGGSTQALEAEVRHSRDWVPRTDYSVEASTGVLRVDQNTIARIRPFRQEANEWDARLVSGVPVDLEVELGAGQSTVDLREVDVRELKVMTGVGETTVDLSGPRASDVTARIEAGIGELTVRVPSGIGVKVTSISEGVGDFSFEGFTKDGDDYVNDAYASSDVKMEITLHQGIGEVTFESVP